MHHSVFEHFVTVTIQQHTVPDHLFMRVSILMSNSQIVACLSLFSLRAIFFRWAHISRYQNVSILDFIQARMMEVVVTAGAIRQAKLQSNCCHQPTITQLFTDQTPFLLPHQQYQSTEGIIHLSAYYMI